MHSLIQKLTCIDMAHALTAEKKKLLLTWRLHIAQASLHKNPQRPFVSLQPPCFMSGDVHQPFGFMLHEKQWNRNPTVHLLSIKADCFK